MTGEDWMLLAADVAQPDFLERYQALLSSSLRDVRLRVEFTGLAEKWETDGQTDDAQLLRQILALP